MDQKAQISVEFILLAGMVMLVVLVFAGVISDQSEMNAVATTVKLGAENATTQQSIINGTMQPMRVTNIDMTGTGNIAIQVHFSGNISSIESQILSSINKSLASSGYHTGYSGGSQIDLQTNKHNYTITLIS